MSATVKIIADGVSVEDATDILIKAVESRHSGDECNFDNLLIEAVLDECNAVYQTQWLNAIRDIMGVFKEDVDLR